MSRKLNNKGFTLVELLVIGFIIGVLTITMLADFKRGQEGSKLRRVAAAIESDIRNAQNLSTASSEFNGYIPCGYGIYSVDSTTYRIYVGKADDCSNTSRNFTSADDVYEDIKIKDPDIIFVSTVSGPRYFYDIFFEPPNPTVYINNSSNPGNSTTIKLCIEKTPSKCLDLIVDTAGRIVIQ